MTTSDEIAYGTPKEHIALDIIQGLEKRSTWDDESLGNYNEFVKKIWGRYPNKEGLLE
jgi:hypothetical protein